MSGEYKASKEAFVSGMTGSSIGHVNMLSFVALASISLHSALRTRLPPTTQTHFVTEFLILAIPLLFSVTLWAMSPGVLSLVLLLMTGVVVLIPPREVGTLLPSIVASRASSPVRRRAEDNTRGDNVSATSQEASRSGLATVPYLPAVTTYRSHMLLLTAICILAVDFPVFPRSLAKCETFGVSVMDLGVGSFVFSQGLVSALPIIKNPSYLTSPFLPKFTTVLRKSLPLLILGLLRTISVKGTEYPEHQTEYGVHWNFFITIGILPVLQVLLHPLIVLLPISLLGVAAAVSHQLALSYGGLTTFVLHAPRTSLISQNKEGLVSLIGYLAIHLLGLSAGTLLLPPSPSYFRRQQKLLRQTLYSSSPVPPSTTIPLKRENDKTAVELCSYAVVWWVLLYMTKWSNVGGGVSRRMVNFPYITWVAAFNTSFLLGYLLLDLIFFPSPMSKSVYSPRSKLKVQPKPPTPGREGRRDYLNPEAIAGGAPPLLDAINKNGLVLFLLANVATGLVNLALPTMYFNDSSAMGVLAAYTLGICGFAWLCRGRRLWRF